jgi:hypothetical protein
MRHHNTIGAFTLIILGLVLVVPVTYGSMILAWVTGSATLLLGVGILLLLCLFVLACPNPSVISTVPAGTISDLSSTPSDPSLGRWLADAFPKGHAVTTEYPNR